MSRQPRAAWQMMRNEYVDHCQRAYAMACKTMPSDARLREIATRAASTHRREVQSAIINKKPVPTEVK